MAVLSAQGPLVETEIDDPHVFIQWKGTDVCLDFYCSCGAGGHFDGYFAYAVKCPKCGAEFALPSNLPLAPSSGYHQAVTLEADDE